MKRRVLLLTLLSVSLATSVLPARAVGVPLMSCNWNGLMHIDSDWSFEAVTMNIGAGSGSCSGTGAGPYDIAFTQGWGFVEVDSSFGFFVTYRLRSVRDGSVRTFRQDWYGRESPDCTSNPFRILKFLQVVVGVGSMSLCPTVNGAFPPPEPIDVPAQFTWRFLPAH